MCHGILKFSLFLGNGIFLRLVQIVVILAGFDKSSTLDKGILWCQKQLAISVKPIVSRFAIRHLSLPASIAYDHDDYCYDHEDTNRILACAPLTTTRSISASYSCA